MEPESKPPGLPISRNPAAQSRRRPERQIQQAIFAHFKWHGAPGVFAWHPFSWGYRRPAEASIYKGLGAIAGLPDVMALHRGQLFGLELKAENGRVTATQAACHKHLRDAGARIAVATGVDAALKQLETWGLLRGRLS
jgi:hypothetical protein